MTSPLSNHPTIDELLKHIKREKTRAFIAACKHDLQVRKDAKTIAEQDREIRELRSIVFSLI